MPPLLPITIAVDASALDQKIDQLLTLLGAVNSRLSALQSTQTAQGATLTETATNLRRVMADLTEITTEVTETGTVVDSAVTLLANLADQIEQNATDPVALQALASELRSTKTELAEAVAANTPGAPEPTPEPPA